MMISCKQAVDFISKKEEGRLALNQRIDLRGHLAICHFCRAFDRQNRLLSSVFHKRPDSVDVTLKAEEKQAIIKILEKAADS